jgi:hypothetical protein
MQPVLERDLARFLEVLFRGVSKRPIEQVAQDPPPERRGNRRRGLWR